MITTDIAMTAVSELVGKCFILGFCAAAFLVLLASALVAVVHIFRHYAK